MKNSYPIILTPAKKGFTVYIPDFDINTEGKDLTDAIEMARDAIGLMGIDLQDDQMPLPAPRRMEDLSCAADEIPSLVDVDFMAYRQKYEQKVVRKNCTLPGWLCYEAEKANINFSQALQKELRRELGISDR